MYNSYDEMFSFSDPEEGAEFVEERLREINAIADECMADHVDSVDEIQLLIDDLNDLGFHDEAKKIEDLWDDQLEEADNIMRSGPDPDALYDGAFD